MIYSAKSLGSAFVERDKFIVHTHFISLLGLLYLANGGVYPFPLVEEPSDTLAPRTPLAKHHPIPNSLVNPC